MTAKLEIVKPKWGEGFYTVPDMAAILDLPYRKMRYWFNEYVKRRLEKKENYRYYFTSNKHDAVNFYSLIEAYVFYQLKAKGFKTKVIINAHDALAELYKTPYPFAKVELLASGGNILFQPLGDAGSLVSADQKMQYQIKEIIEPFSQKILFAKDNGLAEIFYPLGPASSVVVSPRNQFGQPVIKGTNILVETITGLYKAGEGVNEICKMYSLHQKDVKSALDFMKVA